MLTAIKNLTIIALVLASAMPATAKVTPAHKYTQDKFTGDHKQKGDSFEEPEASCEARGYYPATIKNATCNEVKIGKKICYSCSCPPKYEFTCTSTGFAAPGYQAAVGSFNSSSHLLSPSLSSSASQLAGNQGVQLGGQTDHWTQAQVQLASNGCTIGGNTLYETCDCASGYLSSTLLHDKFSSEFSGNPVTIQGKNTGKTITCYQDTFSCKNGLFKVSKSEISNLNTTASTFTVNDDNKFITYKGQSLLKNLSAANNLFCVTGATISSPLYSSRPANTDCAKFKDNQAAKYYPSVKYGYFEVECSQNAYCPGDSANNECISYSGAEIKTFNGVDQGPTKTCKAIIGCNTGIVENQTTKQKTFCASVNASTGFSSNTYQITTPSSSTPQNCYKLSCNTGDGWQQAYIGATKAITEYQADPDNAATHYSYDVRSATSGSNMLVCRQPNGCHVSSTDSTKWYNFACSKSTTNVSGINNANELCWDGWLSLWARVAGK